MRTHLYALAISLVLLGRSGSARADAHEAALTRAVAAKEFAMDHPEPMHWLAAFERFAEADALEPSADTKYELGYIAVQLRQDDLAVEFYELAIELGLTGRARSRAVAFTEAHATSMARLVVNGPAGGRIRIRGMPRGVLPLARPIVAFPGNVVVEFVAPLTSSISSHTVLLEPERTMVVDLNDTYPPRSDRKRTSRHFPQHPDQARTPTARAEPDRHLGGWLLGAGVGLVISGGIAAVASTVMLSNERKQLRAACDVPLPDSENGCQNARPGQYDFALDSAESIARWRTVQGVAWAGVGVGAASAALGTILLIRQSSTNSERVSSFFLKPEFSHRSAGMSFRTSF